MEKMNKYIKYLAKKWKPKTKIESGYSYHGSSAGEKITYTVYFDTLNCDWTTDKNRAFKSYVFDCLNKEINWSKYV